MQMGLLNDEQDALHKQKSYVCVPSSLTEEDLTRTHTQSLGPQNEDRFSQEDATFTTQLDQQKSRKSLQYITPFTSLVIPNKDSYQDDDDDDDEIEPVSQEKILQRINSHEGTKSYQLGKQLSCKWSSGAGPRIGCVRDYPSELQTHALEKVSLSPRNGRLSIQN